MDWANAGDAAFALTLVAVALGAGCALAAGFIIIVSKPLVGFRVPFVAAFKAVVATMAVTMLLRGLGGAIGKIVGPLVGAAVALVGVIIFLAWYLDRYVPRPDGTPLGRGYAYRLACVYGLLIVVLNFIAYGLLAVLE